MGPPNGADGIVEFALTEDEFVAAAFIPTRLRQSALGRSNRRRALWLIFGTAGGIWVLILLGSAIAQHAWGVWAYGEVLREWLVTVPIVVLLTVGVAACIRLWWPRRLRRRFRDPRYAAFAGRRRFAVTPEGLAVSGAAEALLPWSSLAGTRRFPAGLTIDLSQTTHDFIPRRAFADDAALDRFERLVQRHCESAKAPAPPAPSVSAGAAEADAPAISYTLTLEDDVAFLYFCNRRTFARRHQRFISFTGCTLAIVGLIFALNSKSLAHWPDPEEGLALAVVLLLIAGAAVGFWYAEPGLDRRLYRMIARGRGAEKRKGPARVEIAAEGVHLTADDGRRALPWPSIIAVETGAEALYLFLTPEQAHIIPRRAFPDDAAFDAFVAAIRRHWQARQIMPRDASP